MELKVRAFVVLARAGKQQQPAIHHPILTGQLFLSMFHVQKLFFC